MFGKDKKDESVAVYLERLSNEVASVRHTVRNTQDSMTQLYHVIHTDESSLTKTSLTHTKLLEQLINTAASHESRIDKLESETRDLVKESLKGSNLHNLLISTLVVAIITTGVTIGINKLTHVSEPVKPSL